MKSAFLVSDRTDLFRGVWEVLGARGATRTEADGGVIQLSDQTGHLLTVYGMVPPGTEWEYRNGPFCSPDGESVDLLVLAVCVVECRSEEWLAEVARLLADLLPGSLWVLDAEGIAWPAADVDPQRVRL